MPNTSHRTNRFSRRWFAVLAALLLVAVQVSSSSAATPISKITRQNDGVIFSIPPAILRLQVMSNSVIRVTCSASDPLPTLNSLTVVATPDANAKWDLIENADSAIVQTSSFKAKVDRATGSVSFLDLNDKLILKESDGGREISPATQAGVEGTLVRQSFVLPADEGIYGLGQHQQGVWNYRGHTQRLLQENREVAVPVLLSSKGYTLLWDNPAVTDVAVGAPVQANGAGEDVVRWSSEVGKAIDYYFCFGPTPEESIRHYRELTGPAPLMPKWLLGFWQCKERYRTSDELLATAKQYRDLKIPIDGIIQDWRYWPDGGWGSHAFDKARYPDPAALTQQLHAMNYHMLISVWPKFDLDTPNFKELENAGVLYPPVIPYVYPKGQGKWYDAFSAKGREIYWKQISRDLFSTGFDGWWLDASEAELSGKWGEFRSFKTAAGPGSEVFNAYPLEHSTGVYQGQRAQTDDKRVVILTRSAYAGQQRNSAITWSGDIGSSWKIFHDQIPAGLNFSVSGIPYWNTDIGGFFYKPTDAGYPEIFSRWFEFGSFCPMFRVHGSAPGGGTGPGKEYWHFNEPTQKIWRDYVNLRYRLMPYLYSITWQVTSNGSTIMRPLVMDFPEDVQALNVGDQYLFGPAIMVNPVTTKGAISRKVYLPGKGNWYDFWTGKSQPAGQLIDAPAPLQTMPLYVRGGSIVPMGPVIQFTSEKPADPIELRIYPGNDGSFTLYEDEGDSYRYEKGVFATIPFTWNQATQTLVIGQRHGEFPGILKDRTFNIVFVTESHGSGIAETDHPDQVVKYNGQPVSITAPR